MTEAPRYVYLATPYSCGDKDDELVREARYEAVTYAATQLQRTGLIVFSPITHGHVMATTYGLDRPHEWWLELDVAFLAPAQALFVLMLDGWDESPGVKFEIDYAEEHGMPIVYLHKRLGGPVVGDLDVPSAART